MVIDPLIELIDYLLTHYYIVIIIIVIIIVIDNCYWFTIVIGIIIIVWLLLLLLIIDCNYWTMTNYWPNYYYYWPLPLTVLLNDPLLIIGIIIVNYCWPIDCWHLWINYCYYWLYYCDWLTFGDCYYYYWYCWYCYYWTLLTDIIVVIGVIGLLIIELLIIIGPLLIVGIIIGYWLMRLINWLNVNYWWLLLFIIDRLVHWLIGGIDYYCYWPIGLVIVMLLCVLVLLIDPIDPLLLDLVIGQWPSWWTRWPCY